MMKFSLLPPLFIGFGGLACAGEIQCINQDIASVQGLKPGLKASGNLPANYKSVETISGEDDGGQYSGKKYKYEHFEVITVRGHIDSIRISSPLILWIEKIRIGMDRGQVENALGYARIYNDDETSQYLVCSDTGDVYAVLNYNINQLESIEVLVERP
jgi:hypothetical protein